MPHTLVLVHGVFGFGKFDILGGAVNYFVGVADRLRGRVDAIEEPGMNPIGTVAERGRVLGEFLQGLPDGRIDIIAHSMGGLDTRYALHHFPAVAKRVASVVNIGTPHGGTPVAHTLLKNANGVAGILGLHRTALPDLTPGGAKKFNADTPLTAGVRFTNIAGTRNNSLLFLPVEHNFFKGEVHDGLVSRFSAHLVGTDRLPDWPVNHAEEVGFGTPFFSHGAHLTRYDRIMNHILKTPTR